jgi:HEAT repeat protein
MIYNSKGSTEDFDSLVTQLNSEDDNIRATALAKISITFRGDKVVRLLLNALNDPNLNIRRSAIMGLGIQVAYKNNSSVTQALIPFLKNEDAHTRAFAALTLGLNNDVQASEYILPLLNDPDPIVINMAASSLALLGESRAVRPIFKKFDDRRVSINLADSLGRFGEAVLPLIIKASKRKKASVRAAAAKAAGRLGDRRAIPVLRKLLKAKNKWVRYHAVEALGRLKDNSVVPDLLKRLDDKNLEVRRATAESLGRIGDNRAVAPLIKALKNDPSLRVKHFVVTALRDIGDLQAIPALCATLQDKSPELRYSTAMVFYILSDPRAIPALEKMAAEDTAQVDYREKSNREFALDVIQFVKDKNGLT